MALFQFACPYCSGQFEIENPPAGRPVACPHCGGMVALPAELPPPVAEPSQVTAPSKAEIVADSWVASPAETYEGILPFDPNEPIAPALRRGTKRTKPARPREIRLLSREEKERRRLRRNVVLMAVGIVVLAVAAVLLSRI